MEEDARWTCEACGCNTNATADTSCGICGTSQSGPSLLRRGYAARAAWLARGASRIAGANNGGGPGMPDMDEDDLWESVVHGIGEDIMEDRGRFVETARQRFIEAARALAHRNAEPSSGNHSNTTADPQTLWQQACETDYDPYWTDARHNGIEVGIGEEHRHLAHVTPGSGEGRAIRSEEPLPRNAVAGFRVVFENPSVARTGSNMGGCYLIGVTTSSFTAWHEHKGLQSSMYFWGIEDGGQIYEGSSSDRRDADSNVMNENAVIFGIREVVTCISDGRTLTFWRGDTVIGTLVTNLPRASPLYPVVVPFNSNVTVAISAIEDDPLPLVQSFAMDWKKVQQERDERARKSLNEQRSAIIDGSGKPTDRLQDIFKEIYDAYMPNYERFWYCCGFKMKKLPEVKKKKSILEFEDFFDVISRLVADDVAEHPEGSRDFKVGDKVELTSGYEKFGDASGGPLLPGDRGVVVDLQRAPNGEQRSARVLYNGRRWWYQPQAIVSERSGLIDSPCVWFLRKILRSHGYDHQTLEKISGEQLTATSWRVGDVVAPATDKSSIGRITSGSKDSCSVMVEFCDSKFAADVGVRPVGGLLEPKKIEINKLVHWTFLEHWKKTESVDSYDKEDTSLLRNERVRSDVASLGRFERVDMDSLIKECRKSSDTLANLFANGLPDAIMSALDVAERRMNSLEPPEDLSERISSVGDLLTSIADQIYGEPTKDSEVNAPSGGELPEDSDFAVPSQTGRARMSAPSNGNRSRVLLNVRRRADDVQDRRSMLANLVSRAGRRDLPINDDRSSLVFGAPSDFFDAWDGTMGSDISDLTATRTSTGGTNDSGSALLEGPTLLDSYMRCHNKEKSVAGTAAQASFIRQFILFALCSNNVEWAKSLVDVYTKRTQVRQAAVLRSVTDEENSPVLYLALNLRCSAELIGRIIDWGAVVTATEIQLAAEMNQPMSLSYLLQRFSLNETASFDFSVFSDEVQEAFEKAKSRQSELEKAMKDHAGDFMIKILHRLFHLGLTSRRLFNVQIDSCSRVICEILVGNVLLSAVREAQKDEEKKNERLCPEEESELGVPMSPFGLLRILPLSVLEGSLFKESGRDAKFLMLCEDYLCSKDMADIAIGLTLLSVILEKFPSFSTSAEVHRFGMKDFVGHHNKLASKRIAGILSKCQSTGTDMDSLETSTRNSQGVVLCPKKHRATLHITRHSSFRCDLCQVGVERGRPMHGCRQCDWDACEDCTDRFETGLVKCTALQALSSHCLGLLGINDVSTSFDFDDAELKTITSRLIERDESVLADLARLLNRSNGESVSVHQFINDVIPALHSAVVQDENGKDVKGRKVKKAKVHEAARHHREIQKNRFDFLGSALRRLVEQNEESHTANNTSTTEGQDEDEQEARPNLSFCPGASEILRRLHQVLSFRENADDCTPGAGSSNSTKSDDLQSLKKPLVLHLSPHSSAGDQHSSRKSVVHAEPLISMSLLQDQVLRSHRVHDEEYVEFCKRLSAEHAVILEQPRSGAAFWKIAKIMSYNEDTGAHLVRYASAWKRGMERSTLELDRESTSDPSLFRFTGLSANLSLLSRRYYIIFRSPAKELSKGDKGCSEMEPIPDVIDDRLQAYQSAIGNRVESCVTDHSKWEIFTLAGASCEPNKKNQSEIRLTLISDDGEVHENVTSDQVRMDDVESGPSRSISARARSTFRSSRDETGRTGFFPFLVSRQRGEAVDEEASSSLVQSKALKRSWSALALVDELRPIDLQSSGPVSAERPQTKEVRKLKCLMDDIEFEIIARVYRLEDPPNVHVDFGVSERIPPIELSGNPGDVTLVRALKEYHQKQERWNEWPPFPSCSLFFKIRVEPASQKPGYSKDVDMGIESDTEEWSDLSLGRSRKLSERSLLVEEQAVEPEYALSQEFDSCCIKCMEIISAIAECAEGPTSSFTSVKGGPKLLGFSNCTLSKKLIDQLENPVCVVGAALPDWCMIAPSFAPHLFSYDARRALLDRTAFGVSRGALKQQESKVNVGRLRQRMASLRARAVELVGEAFSGGADDPTALQLQADELYGMEETLALKVRAAFRAQNWSEHSLQVAKAAVRRDELLSDAKNIMQRYCSDEKVRMRRLEVRFEGESGFDAASGDEAGVTRGFYADVAEALLSTDVVAGINCATGCNPAVASISLENNESKSIETSERLSLKLPLWIPDMDSSSQVILPSPRAMKESSLGVFPRPLPHYHPQYKEVKQMFRFMGRLFAASLRDGFMFPLPLSASFLKLVQYCKAENGHPKNRGVMVGDGLMLLSSDDLPRPGFLGGEIRAAEAHICTALDELEKAKPPLSRVQLMKRFDEIASDKSFGREALGKRFDCSFNDYFQDRTFVDPFDPTQGQDAAPLCPKGASKPVTVFNIREWVALAKRFVLYDGIIMQAEAFREGIEDFFPAHFLRLFTANELQKDICGSGDQVDKWDEAAIRKIFKLDGGKGATEALVAVAAIGGEGGAALSRRFGPSSPTIGYLIKALLSATPLQRRQFLSFVTSVPIVTPGRIEVVPILSPSGEFIPMEDPSCLPRANTCSRRLYLPKFDNYESFEQVLWAVVRAENKFKGFWEWSGSSS